MQKRSQSNGGGIWIIFLFDTWARCPLWSTWRWCCCCFRPSCCLLIYAPSNDNVCVSITSEGEQLHASLPASQCRELDFALALNTRNSTIHQLFTYYTWAELTTTHHRGEEERANVKPLKLVVACFKVSTVFPIALCCLNLIYAEVSRYLTEHLAISEPQHLSINTSELNRTIQSIEFQPLKLAGFQTIYSNIFEGITIFTNNYFFWEMWKSIPFFSNSVRRRRFKLSSSLFENKQRPSGYCRCFE